MTESPRDLMAGVSGVRGITGSGLTRGLTSEYIAAFEAHRGAGPIVVARDPRASGEDLARVVIETLTGRGREVISLGIVPTPTLLLNTALLGAAGGIMITASHNPEEWNGLKFADPAGSFLSPADSLTIIEAVAEGRSGEYGGRIASTGAVTTDSGAGHRHTERMIRAAGIDIDAVAEAGYSVVVDGCGGAGSELIPAALESFGVTAHRLHCDPDGTFPRPPEPVPEAITDLCAAVVERGADLGFALDPDADRLAVVGPDGIPLGEESTIALAARQVLSRQPGSVAVNLSTTRMVDDVAREFDVPVVRTPVGEINVVEGMRASGSVIGGEGNGGVIHPGVVWGRDALTGAFLILSAMATGGVDLPALRASIPVYSMLKRKYSLPAGGAAALKERLAALPERCAGAVVDDRDGVRLDWPERWIHIRPSNTEPVVRLISEAPQEVETRRQADEIAAILDLEDG